VSALARLSAETFILDGEVAEDAIATLPVYMAFDVLTLDGRIAPHGLRKAARGGVPP
jgi:hypothetical protein